MKNMLLLLLSLSSLTFAYDIHINTGQSLHRALEQIQTTIEKDGYPKDGITVLIEPGDHTFDKTLQFSASVSGTPDKPIIFTVNGNKKATFNGGKILDLGKIGTVTY